MSAKVLSPAQYDVLHKLHEAQSALAYWKTEEYRLRLICVAGLGSADKQEGSESIILSNGWEAQIAKSLNYKLDTKKTSEAQVLMPDEVASELIAWKPRLSVGVYRKLAVEHASIIEPALTITPGAPTFDLVPPTKDRLL